METRRSGWRRVVITGMGTVNPLGSSVAESWAGLCAGRSGVGPIEQFDPGAFPVRFAGEVKGFSTAMLPNPKAAKRMDRVAQFAVCAAAEAVRDAGLDLAAGDPFRRGVVLGCGIGGLNEFEAGHGAYLRAGPRRISPFVIPKMMPNAAPASIAIEFGLMGPSAAVASACSSAADAVGDAYRAIQRGEADVMLAGGAEAPITPMGLGGFVASRALSTRNDAPQAASRPFDRDRDGFVLAEGAGVVVLEDLEHARRRGARIYVELLGYARTNDAYGIAAPHPDGLGAARAIRLAMDDAGLNPADVDYINAHATSTGLGDAVETKALKQALGDRAYRVAISSTKGMTGHLCGASGAIELIAATLAIVHGVVPPTINLENPDPDCDLDYVPNVARSMPVRAALSTSFGFGGHNSCLAIGSLDRPINSASRDPIV
ncbi:beta-ketoacyl-ACP synthase II [Paludisphaera mucosa]|uniref:3-oxoacyl-[acyl-carrier-protein] synthase 2 n=1 Tax=Paludisphaera mucosa TaxID=3030827 RepID=A0ABT6FI37_9BACT|nr:beta-ketoacyl-ACP synthase II [Paludisphaera mucosa]MDG3007221.1 beta-ketoacyl-ACP synthase II [Paludisphaera mucosa]